MIEQMIAYMGDYTITRVTRDNGTGYWKLDDGWVCDYPILYDSGKFGFDNPEWFPAGIIEWTKNVILDYTNK
jgi:hypothetical protein